MYAEKKEGDAFKQIMNTFFGSWTNWVNLERQVYKTKMALGNLYNFLTNYSLYVHSSNSPDSLGCQPLLFLMCENTNQ